MLRLNDKFISDLNIGTMSLLRLTMVTQPRDIDNKGAYYPYIKTESTNLYLFEVGLIKSKFDQKFKTIRSQILYKSVDYLNSMSFIFIFSFL